MTIVIPSSSAEILADPRRFLDEMRKGKVINLTDLVYVIAPTTEIVGLADELAEAGYIAIAPDLPGCSAFGATQEEALAELQVAIDVWRGAAAKAGKRSGYLVHSSAMVSLATRARLFATSPSATSSIGGLGSEMICR